MGTSPEAFYEAIQDFFIYFTEMNFEGEALETFKRNIIEVSRIVLSPDELVYVCDIA